MELTETEKIRELEVAYARFKTNVRALEAQYNKKIQEILSHIKEEKLRTLKASIESKK